MRGRALVLLVIGCLCVGAFAGSAQAEYGAVNEFADTGSGAGQIGIPPGDVAVEQSTGNVFVVDTGNNRVQVFSTSGDSATFLTEFGGGILSQPFGITLSELGGETVVYVSDAGNNRIVKFESDEEPMPTFTVAPGFSSPTQGSGEDQLTDFRAPLAAAPDGKLWAADRPTGQVKQFNSTGSYVADSSFDGSGSPQGVFGGVLDIAVDPSNGNILVVSTPSGDPMVLGIDPSRLERFSSSGGFLDLISDYEALAGVGAVAVDPATSDVFVIAGLRGYKNPPPIVQRWSSGGVLLDDGVLPVHGGGYAAGPIAPGLGIFGGTGRLYSTLSYDFASISKALVVREVARPAVQVNPVLPADLTATEAKVMGTVDPKGLQTSYHFEYRRKGTSTWIPLGDGDAGNGDGPVPVEVTIAGLSPGRAYQVRLLAVNSDRPATSALEEFVTLVGGPTAETKAAIEVTNTSARVRGIVDPRGGATTYYFEYGATMAYGDKIPHAAQSVDPSEPSQVSQAISGLQPGATYHYRIVATNQKGTATGDDRTFITAHTAPEQRVFEKVTPGGKNGYDVLVEFFGGISLPESVHASDDGSLVGFQSSGGFADAEGVNTINDYSARRTAAGWSTHAYAPKGYGTALSGGVAVMGWADDGRHAVVIVGSGGTLALPDTTPGVPNLYRVDTETNELETITTDQGLGEPQANTQVTFVGGSTDLSTVFFEDNHRRTADAPKSSMNLYEWSGGDPKLVTFLPNGEFAPDAHIGSGTDNYDNAVSNDGSKVFFTAGGTIYLREDNTTTKAVSASQKTIPDPSQPAQYWTASEDGRFAFFTTAEQLIDSDTDEVNDLYRYDTVTGDLVRISAGASNPEHAGVFNVSGASADGSYVYFTDALREAEPVFGLYAWHAGVVSYVASPEFDYEKMSLSGWPRVRVSADGTGIVFLTNVSQPAAGGAPTYGADQVYVYDADADELSCASCRSDGNPSLESALLPRARPASRENTFVPAGSPRSISRDGSRVFFTSADPLVPGDTNGKRDAYEYSGGEARLLSTGQDPFASYFLDASESGDDVFIGTRQKLVPSDTDQNYDVYDARLGGASEEDSVRGSCSGDGCQAPLPAQPPDPVIATEGAARAVDCARFKTRAQAKRRAAKGAPREKAKKLRRQAKRLQKQFKNCNERSSS